MATIAEIVANYEVELESAKLAAKRILDNVKAEKRSNTTADEDAQLERLAAKRETVKRNLARALEIQGEEAATDAIFTEARPTAAAAKRAGKPAYDEVMRIGSEARTYTRQSDPHGSQFISDMVMAQFRGDATAWSRLERHMNEERVERGNYQERAGDIATSGMGGLIVPQYLVDMSALAVAARRPFADAGCTHHDLPSTGMAFTVPTLGATGVAIQTTENTGVQETAMTEADLTISVKTAAGHQIVSRQSVERGVGVDEFVMQDLMVRYATVLDNDLINNATLGLDALAATATPTTIDLAHIYPAILGRQAAIEAALLGGAVDFAVMHSRRWAMLSASLSSTWPFVNNGAGGLEQGAANLGARGYGSAVRGVLPNGLKVIVDNNVATNKDTGTACDRIYVVPSFEAHLWEAPGQPVYIRAEQPLANQLSIDIIVYGFYAFTFKRYANAIGAVIALTAPTF